MPLHDSMASKFQNTLLGALLLIAGLSALASFRSVESGAAGFATIESSEVGERLAHIAGPNMEGRDSPSDGQARAAQYIVERFREFELQPAQDSRAALRALGLAGADSEGEEPTFYRPFARELSAPDPDGCSLLKLEGDDEPTRFELGEDFFPIHRAGGSARGPLVFGGFAIQSGREKYDDFKGLDLKGSVVLFFEGEPRHRKKFDGAEVTPDASIWSQLELLADYGAVAALVVQRTPEGADPDPENQLDYRYTWASWQGERPDRQPSKSLPTLHISMDCASALLGTDARKLAAKMDKSGRPAKVRIKDVVVSVDSRTTRARVRHDNLVAVLPGSDEALRDQYVVVGAHYDHIGVGPRGRIGYGADDNGSGVSALLEVAQALAAEPPRRSVIIASFTAEEDGLIGSREFVANLPVPKEQIVAMVNLDQIGFGKSSETSVLGTAHNPALVDVLERARKLHPSGIRKVEYGKREELGQSIQLFQRSDHHEFHVAGIPALFFFEGLPLSDNKNYHTWRDTVEGVDVDKVTHTARLVYSTVWILANDDDRPPPPRD
jgi:hypothetical protein